MRSIAAIKRATNATTAQGHRRCVVATVGSSPSRGTLIFVSSITLLVGLAVVVVGALALKPMLFGDGNEPATIPVESQRGRTVAVRPPQPRGEPTRLHRSILVRVRSLAGLLIMCAGLGALIAVAVGAFVLFVGLKLQS